MNLLSALIAFLFVIVLVFVGITRLGVWRIERRYPPAGSFVTVDGTLLHVVHIARPARAQLPALVFLHGATANLMDQLIPLKPLFEGRAEMLFFDRPGHGWSERGPGNDTPERQAKTLAALMDRLGIKDAILVGHSFGAALAAAFALDFPQRTRGLVFLSPASHPWPGGATAWYYPLAAMPVVGRLFAETLIYPLGAARMPGATTSVFSPNPVPERYGERASIPLVLRPAAFLANAIDVAGLYDFVVAAAPRYKTIRAPAVVISGDRDKVVYEEIHSVGLARDIPRAELISVHNLGHKPDWVAADLVMAAVEKLAGQPRDLAKIARRVEARLASDAAGVGDRIEPAPAAELAPQ